MLSVAGRVEEALGWSWEGEWMELGWGGMIDLTEPRIKEFGC